MLLNTYKLSGKKELNVKEKIALVISWFNLSWEKKCHNHIFKVQIRRIVSFAIWAAILYQESGNFVKKQFENQSQEIAY